MKKLMLVVPMMTLILLLSSKLVYAYDYTEDDIKEIASVVYVEANNQSELGKRLVIDVILNRVDSEVFPSTLRGVLTQKSQFSKSRKTPPDDMIRLVNEELVIRSNTQVLFFKTRNYHTFAVPVIKEGEHYFSGL